MADESNFLSRALAARMRGYNGAGVISAALNTDDYQDMERQRMAREEYMAYQMKRQRDNDAYVDKERQLSEPVQTEQRKEQSARAKLNTALAENSFADLPNQQKLLERKRESEKKNLDLQDAAKRQAFNDDFVARGKRSFVDMVSSNPKVAELPSADFERMMKDPTARELQAYHLAGRAMQLVKDGNPYALDSLKSVLDDFDIGLEEKDGHYFITLPGQETSIQVDSPEGEAALQATMEKAKSMTEDWIDVYHRTSANSTRGFAPGRIIADRTAELQNIIGCDRKTAFDKVNEIMKTFNGREVRAMCLSQALKKAGEDGNYTSEEMQGMYPFFQQDGWEFHGDESNPSTFRFKNPSMGIDHEIGISDLQEILEKNDRITPAFEKEKTMLEEQRQQAMFKQQLEVQRQIAALAKTQGNGNGGNGVNGGEGDNAVLNQQTPGAIGKSYYGTLAVSPKMSESADRAAEMTFGRFEQLGIGERNENGLFLFHENIPFDVLEKAARAEKNIAADAGIDVQDATFKINPLYDKVKSVVDVFDYMIDSHYASHQKVRDKMGLSPNGHLIDGKSRFKEEEENRDKKFLALVEEMNKNGVDLKLENKNKNRRHIDTQVNSREYLRVLYDWLQPYMTTKMKEKYERAMNDKHWNHGWNGGQK